MPNKKYTYDADTDYTLLIREAESAGDLAAAARYEQQRNRKIRDLGLGYPETARYVDYLPENRYRFDPAQDADYQSARADMDAAFQALVSDGEFSYDPERDPVYQAYAARYLREGRGAMEDTLGRAAALTGGYGSTYAEGAAQQAYDAYLKRLNDVLPDLYGAAYQRHREQQSDKATRYGYARAAADKAYDRAYASWAEQMKLAREDETVTAARYAENKRAAEAAAQAEAEAERAEAEAAAKRQREDAQLAQKYAREDAQLAQKYAREDAAAAEKRRREDESNAQKLTQTRRDDLAEMIFKTGYTPTDAELAAAGMTRAEAEAWKRAYYTNLWT